EARLRVIVSATVAATNKDAPLALVTDFGAAVPLGLVLFAVLVAGLYLWTRPQASSAPPTTPVEEAREATFRSFSRAPGRVGRPGRAATGLRAARSTARTRRSAF